jgi:hypothetical protein
MDGQAVKQMHYLATDRVKNLTVQKKSGTDYMPLHLGTVEISPTVCIFEVEGQPEFTVGEEVDLLFHLEDGSLGAKAIIAWLTKCELLDSDYEHKAWFSYGAEFAGELNIDLFKRVAGDPKRSQPLPGISACP